jgi:hypothetical protein
MEIDQLWSSTIAGACTGGILAALARKYHQPALQAKRLAFEHSRGFIFFSPLLTVPGPFSCFVGGPKAVPSGTFMFGVMALGGQWVWSKSNRFRQDRIIAQAPIENSTTSVPLVSAKRANREAVGSGLLNVLPVHRTDVDDYEVKLQAKLKLIEEEERILEAESLRRERVATEKAVPDKAA